MGGFAGGDEGGYWDSDDLYSLVDKQKANKTKNADRKKLYIKISDSKSSIKVYAKELYGTISFIPSKCEVFTVEGCEDIPSVSNDIYKAYQVLCEFSTDLDISDFFDAHKVVVTKYTSLQTDYEGISSVSNAFIDLLKEVCNLVLSNDELAKIAHTVKLTSFPNS